MFELSDDELEDLRTKFSSANISSKSRYNPHVFTEQGLYMLMTVLKGELATKQSKALIRTFKKMKDYILDNQSLIGQRLTQEMKFNLLCIWIYKLFQVCRNDQKNTSRIAVKKW